MRTAILFLCSHRGKDRGARWRSLLTAQAKLSSTSSQLSPGYGNSQSFFWGDQWFTFFLLPAGGPYSDCGFVVTSALVQSHNYFHVSLPFRCKLLSQGAMNCAGWRCFLPSRLPQMEDKVNISQYDTGSCCKKNDELLAKDHPIGHSGWLPMALIFML